MTDHQSTHAPGCWGWGPKHYECAVAEIERLREAASAVQGEPVAYIRQEDFEFILADDKSEPYGTRQAPVFSRKDCRAPVPLYSSPQPQVQQADECGFTELTEKVAEIELAALEEALVKREKALAKWKANGSSGMDEELEAIHKEFHSACYAGRIQNVVYVLKAALADISRLRKAIECSRPIDDSSAAQHNKHVAAFDNMINDMNLRDYFAAKAMHAIITEPAYEGAQSFFMYFKKRLGLKGEGMDAYAQVSYAMADAMLKAREASND